MTTLREVAQQALEALEQRDNATLWHQATHALRAALAQEDEMREMLRTLGFGSQCPESIGITLRRWRDGYAAALAQQAEPVEPVAKVELMMTGGNAGLATRIVEIEDHLRERLRPGQQLYIAPPQRKLVPLTEEEILAAVGWERAEMYMKLATNFPVDEAKQETLKNARAVERAVWEKNHG